jgi:serine/threonine protein phosphatase PrpC
MSLDHKPSREDESKRIREAGGFVINNRVMGELAVSRAFGDAEFKKGIKSIIEEEGVGLSGGSTAEEQKSWDQPLIIAEPDVEVCVCLSIFGSVCLCVCLSVCVCVCISHIAHGLSLHVYMYIPVCMSMYPFHLPMLR